MKPARRKQLLLAALGLILVFYGGDWVLTNWIDKPKKQRQVQLNALQGEIKKYDQFIARAAQDSAWLRYWNSQSLPSNSEIARSLYQTWLLEVADYAKLARRTVNSTEPLRRGAYYSINFTLQGIGSLKQVTEFLYEFYNAGHLHKITSISLTPVGQSGTFSLSLVIETLILPGADRRDRLSDVRAYRLASASLADYDVIAERNIFAVGGGGGADPTNHTFLTAVNYVNGEPQAWFTQKTDGSVMKLQSGDTLVQTADRIRKLCRLDDLRSARFDGVRSPVGTVGEIESGAVLVAADGKFWLPSLGPAGRLDFQPFDSAFSEIGEVTQIEDTDLVLKSGDESWLLSIGDCLNDAFAMPPELQ